MTRKKTTGRAAGRSRAGGSKTRPRGRPVVSPRDAPAVTVSDTERHKMISDRAYEKSLQRNPNDRDPEEDWLEAEREIDAELLGSGRHPDAR